LNKISKNKKEAMSSCESCQLAFNRFKRKPTRLMPCTHVVCSKCLDSLISNEQEDEKQQQQQCLICMQAITDKNIDWSLLNGKQPKKTDETNKFEINKEIGIWLELANQMAESYSFVEDSKLNDNTTNSKFIKVMRQFHANFSKLSNQALLIKDEIDKQQSVAKDDSAVTSQLNAQKKILDEKLNELKLKYNEAKRAETDPIFKANLILNQAKRLYDKKMYAESLKLFKTYTKLFPSNDSVECGKADSIIELYNDYSKLREALASYTLATRINSENVNAWKGKMTALMALEKHTGSELNKCIDKFIEFEKQNSEAMSMKAAFLFTEQNYLGSLSYLNRAIWLLNQNDKQSLSQAELYFAKAKVLQKLDRHEEADRFSTKATSLDPYVSNLFDYIDYIDCDE